MESTTRRDQAGRRAPIAAMLLIFFVLVVSRRWQQLTSPEVWVEDGRVISGYIANGWTEMFRPMNGYLILVPRIITGASLSVSIYYYPLISSVLACLFAAGVGVAVATSPTSLTGKMLCAFSVFLVPSDIEVFGLPIYTLWWAPVLLLLVALWENENGNLYRRVLYVVLGGLSSPYVLVVLPVLYYRALVPRRYRPEAVVALAATVVAAVQVFFIVHGAAMAPPPAASFATYVIPRFCGWFLFGGFSESGYLLWPAGIAVLALIAAFLFARRRDTSAWVLVYLYAGSIASAVWRNDPAALHPGRGGPRYFFFPFFLTSWILIELALTTKRKWLSRCAAVAVLAGAVNAIPFWTRHHDDLQWKDHLASARLFPRYAVPTEYDGYRFRAWSIVELGSTWDALLRSDHLLSPSTLDGLPTFAFRVVPKDELDAEGWDAGDAPPTGPVVTVAATGGHPETTIKLSRSRRVRFRSGPASDFQSMEVAGHERQFINSLPLTNDWVVLEFSNSRLPGDFTIRVVDHGEGVGEWAPMETL